jgi:signal transduction histidine kinase
MNMVTDHLKFSPEILRRLGEELTPHPDQGVLELVRNAYDADALTCSIALRDSERVGGTITIIDNGDGMKPEDITNGWLLIGKSSKLSRRRTPLGRLIVGNKGLGRLAALRLGSAVRLQTRPKSDPTLEHSLIIDWSRYEAVGTVEQVKLEIVSSKPTLPTHGTKIVIENVSKLFLPDDVRRLARSLLLLSDPFEGKTGFRPTLLSPEFKELEKLVREKYFKDAELHLEAKVQNGRVSAKVLLPNGKVKWSAAHEEITAKDDEFKCPDADFQLWFFLLKGASFTAKSSTLPEVKRWLGEYGGVHLYHRGLRVQPYGDPGHDWLDMNLARVRSPEDRPSTNNSIGRVVVQDANEVLVQKTDRSGFVESDQFFELRRFAQDVLEWLAKVRLNESEKRREREREGSRKSLQTTKTELSKALSKVPRATRPAIQKAIQSYEAAREREVKLLRAEVQLYRTLSTVGTTYAVFAHELAGPGRRIRQLAESVARRAEKELGAEQYKLRLGGPVSSILQNAEELMSFPQLALKLLEREKRKQGRIKLHDTIYDVVKLVASFVAMYKTKIDLHLGESNPEVFGSVAALESILMNLLINALNAFVSGNTKTGERLVQIYTETTRDDNVILRVLDSGPGISGLSIEEIWLPGRTTSPEGTGFGLTIVRDSVLDLEGKVTAKAHSDLGGAEFIVRLPLAVDRKGQ